VSSKYRNQPHLTDAERKGPLAWMVFNRVTPNLIMLVLIIGGLIMARSIKQEVFPEFDLDLVTVRVPYPGASPEEVEQGIILAIEENIRGIDGIKEISATAAEGSGSVSAELLDNADAQKAYQDIQQAIDRITTFPDDAEEPEVSVAIRRRQVLTVELFGDVGEWVVREAAEITRERLLQTPDISQVELAGERDYEIIVEIPQETLRRYGLTVTDIANKIRSTAVEVPGGKIETSGGEILLRVMERRDWASEFEQIPIISTSDGAIVHLGDLATITDDFEDVDREGSYDAKRAIGVEVYRVGSQTPISVSDAAWAAMDEIEADLPAGVDWRINTDRSDIYRQRMNLLMKNAAIGLALVLLILGIFLDLKLAFWVTLGIPTSFLGAMLFLPGLDVTINMISMFAFIVALGIVVDDAIVAGENIYEYRQQGMDLVAAAVRGVRDVAMPITFSILTNIVAFAPMLFVPGTMGKIWAVIPWVVTMVFAVSLIEALIILPSHLAHTSGKSKSLAGRFVHDRQQAFSLWFRHAVERYYGPLVALLVRYRTVTLAVAIGVLISTGAFIQSGRIARILMPRVESDRAAVTAVLPFGSPMERAREVRDVLLEAADEVLAANGGDRLASGAFTRIDSNEVDITLYLTDPDVRPISTAEVTRQWREATGAIPGLESLRFQSDRGGPGSGAALSIELSHRDIATLDRASADLAARLAEFDVVRDPDDGYTPGKEQLDFRIKPEGETMGLTAEGIARQVRASYQGSQAIKQQRGRNEITVRVRRPQAERENEFDLETMIVRTPRGGEVPLMDVAEVTRGRAYTTIDRRDGRRTVTVTADVEPINEVSRVATALTDEVLPQLTRDYPGLTAGFAGRQEDMRDSMSSLVRGLLMAMIAIYVLLAIPFRSYLQPIVVLAAIPFGIVGAVTGHIIMGYSLSVISMMGIVALSGVVVNDSLVLCEYANRLRREEELDAKHAIIRAAVRRFRPILLTTMTTFGGLAPMIFETSRQARFLIPMAISLGFGIVFATLITLVVVPCLYAMLDDVTSLLGRVAGVGQVDYEQITDVDEPVAA
jgi:multidrug efflux pump subunit AcrB